jgi:hypothetical protein
MFTHQPLMRGLPIVKRLFLWAFIFLLLQPVCAEAAPPKKIIKSKSKTTVLTYDVYAGGFHALDALLTIKNDTKKYDVKLTAETQGILKKLANWSGEFETKGLISKSIPSPLVHNSSSIWKEETESKTFKYNGWGKFISYKVSKAGENTTPADLDKSLAVGTTDNLSATLRMMLDMPKNKVCNGNSLVYDGDRTYRLVFAETSTEVLEKTDYNAYQGSSVSCTVEVKPEGGKWRKKPRGWLSIQEQGRQKGSLPTIWFGQLAERPDLYVPVKIRVKTEYGTLFMHLKSASTQ